MASSDSRAAAGNVTHAFMIKVCDLLAEYEVFKQGWATLTSLEALLIFNGTANVRSQINVVVVNLILLEMCSRASFASLSTGSQSVSVGEWALGLNEAGESQDHE